MASVEELVAEIFERLNKKSATISFAESCTGGKLSAAVVNFPGISKVFLGSVVAYDNSVKTSILKVAQKTLESHGAVSRETALEMAKGAQQVLNSTFAVSVTGIAGPSGGSVDKPVGTVMFAVVGPGVAKSISSRFDGDRSSVQDQAVVAALQLVLTAI